MMLADLFIIDRGLDDETLRDVGDKQARAVGVFTSAQSLVAFPLSTSIVATVTRAGRTIARAEFDSVAIPLVAALIVGGALFALTVSDPRARPRTSAGWLAMSATAFINGLLLFVAALGIEKF